MVHDWLRLFRAQTAPATVYSLVVPYLMAGGRDPATTVALFFLGHVLHYASFGHNSLMDFLMNFDTYDPNKKHHPLVASRIDSIRASWVIHGLLFTSLLGLGIIAHLHGSTLALLALMMYAVWGYAYNNGLDHLTKHSWLPISLCFAFLPLYGYFLVRGLDVVAVLLALWGFTVTFYQIALEGNLKDIWNPFDRATKLIRHLCSPVETIEGRPGVICREDVDMFLLVRIGSHVIAVVMVYLLNAYPYSIVIMLVGLPLVTGFTYRLHKVMTGQYWVVSREEMLEAMGKQEVLAFYWLIVLVGTGINWWALLLLPYGVLYFVLMNKALWKSKFGPRV